MSARPPRMQARFVCRWLGHALFVGRCTRCGYKKPFIVGKARDVEKRP